MASHPALDACMEQVYFLDNLLRIQWANSAALEATGMSLEALSGRSCSEAVTGGESYCDGCPVRTALETGEAASSEVIGFDGKVWRITGEPIHDEVGSIVGIVEVVRAVRYQDRLEGFCPSSTEYYQTLVETCPDGITVTDLEGQLLMANERAAHLYGCEKVSEFLGLGLNAFELIAPADRHKAKVNARKALEIGCVKDLEYRLLRINGEAYPAELSVSVIRDERGEPEAFIAVVRDISSRRQAEAERRRLQAQIQHSQKLESLGVLAGGIAHDFNNLLMGILGNASLLLRTLEQESKQWTYAKRIEKTSQHAADLTRQMLAYSGKGEFHVESINLSELVEEMAHLLKISLSKKVTLSYDFATRLPMIEADASQIRQVVMNLITNASEAIGGENGVVRVSTGKVMADRAYFSDAFLDRDLPLGLYAFVEVSDTGCGMDEKTKARIFNPFFSTKFTGRGLGLAAALGIVRRHGGAIRVYSEVGQGTTIKVLFRALPVTAPSSRPTPLPIEAPRSGATVLVVDDEETVRLVVRDMLESSGFDVLEADNGEEGVRVYKEHMDKIGVVLLDVAMPNMDGRETYEELCRVRDDVQVLLSSGYSEQNAMDRFRGKELAGFIQKPYILDNLLEELRRILKES